VSEIVLVDIYQPAQWSKKKNYFQEFQDFRRRRGVTPTPAAEMQKNQ